MEAKLKHFVVPTLLARHNSYAGRNAYRSVATIARPVKEMALVRMERCLRAAINSGRTIHANPVKTTVRNPAGHSKLFAPYTPTTRGGTNDAACHARGKVLTYHPRNDKVKLRRPSP